MPPLKTAQQLAGLRILVTRPLEQSELLADMIAQHGGTGVVAPCLEAIPLPPSPALKRNLSVCGQQDVVIFISRNAVIYANQLGVLKSLSGAQIFALGESTASALQQLGTPRTITPDAGYDSESLLSLPQLQDVNGKHIHIVRGKGGREELRDRLSNRGAIVSYIETYQRQRPADCRDNVRQALQRGVSAIVVNSAETLENFLTSVAATEMSTIGGLPMFVPSQRVATLAQAQGFKAARVTRSPDNAGITVSLIEWATTRSVTESNER